MYLNLNLFEFQNIFDINIFDDVLNINNSKNSKNLFKVIPLLMK